MSAPIKKFQSGYCSVAIFENKFKENITYSITPQNGYYDKNTQKSVYNNFYNYKDILIISKLLEMAWVWINNHKNKQKDTNSQQYFNNDNEGVTF